MVLNQVRKLCFAILAPAVAAAFLAAPSAAAQDAELVTNGDFSAGYSGFSTTFGQNGGGGAGNSYVTTNPNSNCGCFYSFGDHTTGTGNMFVFDPTSASPSYFWEESFAVAPNSDYAISFWTANAASVTNVPVIDVSINGSSIGTWSVDTPGGSWAQYTATWNSGANTSVTFTLTDLNTNGSWNDGVIDDISFFGPAPTPEPASWAMMIGGFGVAGAAMRRRRAARALA